jgi:hypothetical protein
MLLTTAEALPLEKIASVVEAMRRLPQADWKVTHRFTTGLYIRELFVPKGTRAVTMIHRVEHPYFVMSGLIAVWTPNEGRRVISAPFSGVTQPGTIRLAIALEDTVWVTVHATDKQTVAEVEADVVLDPVQALALEQSGELAGVLSYEGIK